MTIRKGLRGETADVDPYGAQAFLHSPGDGRTIREYGRGETVFMQGDGGREVFYIQSGGVTLSVRSTSGKDAVVAMLGPGEFFGEGCLAGQALRTGTATAMTPATIVVVRRAAMEQLLRERGMSECFLAHILSRNARMEADLIDQLFNSTEKRLARALLLLAHYGDGAKPARGVPAISQKTLAGMIGATRSQVNLLLNQFKRHGFIEYDGRHPLKINGSLLGVVLRD